MNELKPCPFCGVIPEQEAVYGVLSAFHKATKCVVKGYFPVEFWNTRTPDSEQEGKLASIADCLNQELRENGGDVFQVNMQTDFRPAIRKLVDLCRTLDTRKETIEKCIKIVEEKMIGRGIIAQYRFEVVDALRQLAEKEKE